jgi:ferredoxin
LPNKKTLDELKSLIGEAERILVLGCGTCVTVCFAGGSREAAITAASLRMATRLEGNGRSVSDLTVQRQCEWEYLDAVAEHIQAADLVLSLGCGIGVQAVAERYPETWVVPGLNTTFLGLPTETGCVGRALCCLWETAFSG